MNAGEDRLLRTVALALGLLPEPLRRRIAGRDGAGPLGARLDSRIAALMGMSERAGRGFRPDFEPAHFRAVYAQMNRAFGLREAAVVDVREVEIAVPDGAIGGRLYRPGGARGALPLLVYFHGGGFAIGDVAGYDGAARFFAARGSLAVLSVEYRLAPEHRFPQAHEDGFSAFAWAQRAAASLGADPERIAVGGDSAGGGIAAAIGAFAGERGLKRPAYQLLIYPSVDGTGATPARTRFERGVPLTTATIAWFASRYVRSDDDLSTPLLAPLRASSLAASPPAYLLAAGFDPLVDEGRLYAERLRAEGVPVVYDLRPSLAHGFVNLAGVVPDARRALLDAVRATAAALRGPTHAIRPPERMKA